MTPSAAPSVAAARCDWKRGWSYFCKSFWSKKEGYVFCADATFPKERQQALAPVQQAHVLFHCVFPWIVSLKPWVPTPPESLASVLLHLHTDPTFRDQEVSTLQMAFLGETASWSQVTLQWQWSPTDTTLFLILSLITLKRLIAAM